MKTDAQAIVDFAIMAAVTNGALDGFDNLVARIRERLFSKAARWAVAAYLHELEPKEYARVVRPGERCEWEGCEEPATELVNCFYVGRDMEALCEEHTKAALRLAEYDVCCINCGMVTGAG